MTQYHSSQQTPEQWQKDYYGLLCELLRAAESDCFLGLVRHTTEFAYLQELEKLSLKWIATYRSLTEQKLQQEEAKSSFQQFRQGFVMQLESL